MAVGIFSELIELYPTPCHILHDTGDDYLNRFTLVFVDIFLQSSKIILLLGIPGALLFNGGIHSSKGDDWGC